MNVLSAKDLRLVELVSCVTRGDWQALQNLRQNAPSEEPDREWREALLQCHLFLGVPRVVEAFEQLALVGGLHPTHNAASECTQDEDLDGVQSAGEELFGAIYGDLSSKVQRRLRQHDPHFATWILEHAYGRVLSRPGLEAKRRELLALVCLALGNLERQLASHTRGAIRLGASAAQVRAVLESQRAHLSTETYERMQAVAQRFSAES